MAISFTKSVSGRLTQEIADLELQITEQKKKKDKALLKINQLERDSKLSSSASELSSKMSRISKLKADIKKYDQHHLELSKEANKKKTTLAQLPPTE